MTLLVVDPQPKDRELLVAAATREGLTVRWAQDLAEARQVLGTGAVDLVVLAADGLAEDQAVAFTREVKQTHHGASALLISAHRSADDVLAAYRAGAADVLVRPLKAEEVSERLRSVAARVQSHRRWKQRVHRLRRLCRKLEAARKEISQQVDVLCSDLVTAYQEMAQQVQSVVQTSDFVAAVRGELDLEQVLRKTLEYLLQKAGSTNAGIFLPVNNDEYSLGGYVNYDWTSEAPDALLQQMADVLAPAVAAGSRLVHVEDHEAMAQWLGEGAAFLEDYQLIAMPCAADGEVLAVLTLFRHNSQPFTDSTRALCESLGPLLAEYLLKLIRIHHRHVPDLGNSDESDNQAA